MPEVLLAERNGTGEVSGLDVAAARRRLEDVRDELDRTVAVLNSAHQRHPLVADYPQDPADAGTNLAESDRAEAILAAAKARRVLVLDALVRLDDGSYGVCVNCGKPVPEGRLEVKPEAARCLTCQSEQDRLRR
ncbi:MAG TPA: TraR/DksA C4-type zinc finger protein [Streptosporangiaceae bacterium]|nr:TraR/DksA C4-type zinc finger protein [Streptosporangiaceae bacterium]